ncbi:hypothetical protein [Flavobacterium tyrosinilyticum]|uniref:hypothetical protein n=1 Tax=Flavobacterium tyrosinilyticum TaxID=1658740 RepID=UPI00202E5EDC|nr:hypothetical protein [Flavobacterium tyrosinilyticum]MCM0666143.1 hypothetical protein [Flavobacterium tyrosinilyticum]
MKQLFFLLFICTTALSYSQSNQILDFKIRFSPQTIYNQTMTNSASYELTYEGSEELLNTLKSSGVKNPTITNSTVDMESVFKTGKANADGSFPVVIKYLKSLDNKGNTIIPNGTLIYGKGSITALPKLDSIVAKGIDDISKNTFFEIAKSSFSQLALPEKKLKVGEAFSQESPLNIPIGPLNIDMSVTTIYRLTSIFDKNAYFDINQIYTANVSSEKLNNIIVSGIGTGKMTYDIPNYFTSESSIDMKLMFDLKQDEFNIKLNSSTSIKQTAKISKYK